MIVLKTGETLIVDLETCKKEYEWLGRLLSYANWLNGFRVDCDGNAVMFSESKSISAQHLIRHGQKLPIDGAMLRKFACEEIISTGTAMKILGCSRQNIDDMVKRGRLTPAPIDSTSRMFFREDILNL